MENNLYLQIKEKLSEIEKEMKRVGIWETKAPTPDAYTNMGAFGQRTMCFEQWIRYVFIPRVHKIMNNQQPLPPSSSLAVYAAREFDGRDETHELQRLLREFDQLIPRQQISKTKPRISNTRLVLMLLCVLVLVFIFGYLIFGHS